MEKPHRQSLPVLALQVEIDGLGTQAARRALHGGEQCRPATGDDILELHAGIADLGDIVSGAKPGRVNEDEIIIFDSTGTAIE